MAMTESSREVGVVVRRRTIDNPWIDHMWSPLMILDEVPATTPWTVLSQDGDATMYYAGSAFIDLFSTDAANYRDNLADGAPLIWVALRRQDGGAELELTKVTADPTEGEALFESGTDVIGTVPMPPDIASWGGLLNDAQYYYDVAWWLMLFPGLFLVMTTLAFNLLGDGLRDALDVRADR